MPEAEDDIEEALFDRILLIERHLENYEEKRTVYLMNGSMRCRKHLLIIEYTQST